MKIQKHFLFLEFLNPKVRAILTSLRDELHGYSLPEAVHITVRGPYKNVPEESIVLEMSRILEGALVAVKDAGIFKTPKGYAVYLHAYSRIFDALWWKPDFSGPTVKRIPHVTMYETNDKSKADAVFEFLTNELIDIATIRTELTIYSSKQTRLILNDYENNTLLNDSPAERVRVNDGLINRARQLHYKIEPVDASKNKQLELI
jgi:hypothetical protein